MLYQNKNKTGDYKKEKCVLWSDFTEYIWVVGEEDLSEWDRGETVKNYWRRVKWVIWYEEGMCKNEYRMQRDVYSDELNQEKVEMQRNMYVSLM